MIRINSKRSIDRYLLPAPELSSKPTARLCCCRSKGQTDRRFKALAACMLTRKKSKGIARTRLPSA